MDSTAWDVELALMRRAGVHLAPGLSPMELAAAEARYGFRFPADLRAFLGAALPLGNSPNWRALGSAELEEMLQWPLHGLQFDVQHNAFWWPAWGPRPDALVDATAVAERELAKAPFLIPLYSHRYLPAEPAEAGNPVLSVYQTDIIYYGRNLRDYFTNEFAGGRDVTNADEVRYIRFWSDVIATGGDVRQ
jgi:hypothetical protein